MARSQHAAVRQAERERLFVDAWFANNMNSTAAAVATGSVQKNAPQFGMLMLKRPSVRELIRKKVDKITHRHNVTLDKVVTEMARIGFSNLANYTRLVGTDRVIDLTDCTMEQMAAVKKLVVEEYKEGRGDDARDVKRVIIELHEKVPALVNLGKHLGMFRKEFTGEADGTISIANTTNVHNHDNRSLTIVSNEPADAAKEYLKLMALPPAPPPPGSTVSSVVIDVETPQGDDDAGHDQHQQA